MTETDNNKPELYCQAIAEEIALKSLGEVFTFPKAKDVVLSFEVFKKIEAWFITLSGIPQPKSEADVLNKPDFCIMVAPGAFLIYKDTAKNIDLFGRVMDDINGVLSGHPEAYSAIINALTAKIPISERGDYGMVPLRTPLQSMPHFNLDSLPLSVLKALRQTTIDPNMGNVM